MFTTAKGHFWGDLQLVLFLDDVWNIESYIEIQLVNCLRLCTEISLRTFRKTQMYTDYRLSQVRDWLCCLLWHPVSPQNRSSWTAAVILADSLDGSCFEPPRTRLNRYQTNIYCVVKASSPKEWQKQLNRLFELNLWSPFSWTFL